MTDTIPSPSDSDAVSERVLPILKDTPEGADIWERTPYRAEDYGPVSDWATDFDHADPDFSPVSPKRPKSCIECMCIHMYIYIYIHVIYYNV